MTKKDLNLKLAELAVEILKAEMLLVNNGVGDSGLYKGQYQGFPSYDIYNNLTAVPLEDGFRINLPDYFIFIESGRAIGAKMPPMEVILAWMTKNRISGGNSVAYAIGRSIVENGIRKRPFIDAALTAIVESSTLETDILEYFDTEVRNLINSI